MSMWTLLASLVALLAAFRIAARVRKRAATNRMFERIRSAKLTSPPGSPASWNEFAAIMMRELDEDLRRDADVRAGALLARFGFLFGKRVREDIEATITDLGLDAEEMRARGFSRGWILFIIKAREIRELAAFLWQWLREIRLPRAGHGRNEDEGRS